MKGFVCVFVIKITTRTKKTGGSKRRDHVKINLILKLNLIKLQMVLPCYTFMILCINTNTVGVDGC